MSGSELDEPDAPEYLRLEIENDLAHWANDSVPQEIYNIGPHQFTTAVVDWGRVGYWALCNAPVDGYNFVVGSLDAPIVVQAGDQVVFEEGDLSFSLGPFYLAEAE